MFGIGLTEIIIILVVALLVVGPKKLPELAKTLGRSLAEFRKTADDFKTSVYQDEETSASDQHRSAELRQISKIQSPEDPPTPVSSKPSENRETEHKFAENKGDSKSAESES